MLELTAEPKAVQKVLLLSLRLSKGEACSNYFSSVETLKKGDSLVVGESFGRARSLMDSTGKMLQNVPINSSTGFRS